MSETYTLLRETIEEVAVRAADGTVFWCPAHPPNPDYLPFTTWLVDNGFSYDIDYRIEPVSGARTCPLSGRVSAVEGAAHVYALTTTDEVAAVAFKLRFADVLEAA